MKFKILLFILVLGIVCCLGLSSASAANTTIDNSTSGGINGAITNDPSDIIILEEGIYSGSDNNNIVINKSVTIKGNGPSNKVIIDGSNLNQIFYITPTGSLTLINITLRNGYSSIGGTISNTGMLNIDNCIFTGNNAPSMGGAIDTLAGTCIISNSIFSNNYGGNGGAISNHGTLTIINSTFLNNTADLGGAIYSQGLTSIIGSIFKNNVAGGYGGAILVGPGGSNSNLNISYSILVNNKDSLNHAVSNSGNITADYNWWGSNNPINLTNFDLGNYYTMILNTSILNNTLEIGDTLYYNYYFVLNGTNDNDNAGSYFPYFEVDIYKNGVLIDTIDGRENQVLSTVLDSKVSNFSTTLDYEKQGFTILATEPIPPIPPIPPKPPEPNNNTNHTSNNSVATATMKETGIPFIAVLLVLLASLGLFCRKQ